MGLNLSNQQIAQALSLHKDDVHQITSELRQAVTVQRPEVQLSGTVEFDEVYVTAGHKGQPESVKKKGRKGRRRKLKGVPFGKQATGTRNARQREAPDLRDDSARWRSGDPNARECSTADHQTDYSGHGEPWNADLHR
jgi:hypothetical protein